MDKEAVMLSKLILGLALITFSFAFPPTVLICIIAWAIWTLYNNYNDKK